MARHKGQLLIDEIGTFRPYQVESTVVEIRDKKVPAIVGRGSFGTIGEATANGRVYRKSLMEREIQKLNPAIDQKRVYGELDHPADGRTSMKRVSHLITKLEVRGNEVYGEMVVIPKTPNGKIAAGIMEVGGQLGVSSRGFGTTTKNAEGKDVVNDDYTLVTYDLVGDPAAANAYPEFSGVDAGDVDFGDDDEGEQGFGESRERLEETMNLEELKAKHPELVEAIRGEVRATSSALVEEARRGAVEEGRKAAEQTFESRLPEIEKSIRAKVEEEIEKDPATTSGRAALAKIRPILAPFVLGEDAATAIKAKDGELRERDELLGKQHQAMNKLMEERDEAIAIGRRALLNLHMERKLGDQGQGAHPCAVQLRSLMGPLSESMTVEQIDQRLEEVAGSILEERMAQQEKQNALDEMKRELEAEKAKVKTLQEQVHQVAVTGYIAARCAGHSAEKKLVESITARKPKTKTEVDSLFEELTESVKPSTTFTDVQSSLRRRSLGPQGANNGDGQRQRPITESAPQPGQIKGELLGVDLASIRRAAGIQSK